jgi:hypothetical protein
MGQGEYEATWPPSRKSPNWLMPMTISPINGTKFPILHENQELFYKVYVESFLSGKNAEGEVQCFTNDSHYKSRM